MAQESWTDALREQDSRFAQCNDGINSSESGPLAEAPEGRSRGVAQETLRPALGEQKSRFGQWNGGINSSESGPLAEAPEGQLTQAAERSSRAELSRAGQRRSREGAQETLRPSLGEQKSRFGQWNGGKDSPESGPHVEAPQGQLAQTAELSLEQS